LSYCCSGFKAASAKSTLASDAENAAEQVAEAAAEQAALDLAAKAFCRVAVPALLAPLELLEDLIPIIGKLRGFHLFMLRQTDTLKVKLPISPSLLLRQP
jgi:hypothetical protein